MPAWTNYLLSVSMLVGLLTQFTCAATCSYGKFGATCSHDCHCEKQDKCDQTTGTCESRKCEDGWTSSDSNYNCQHKSSCMNTYYGRECRLRCHCGNTKYHCLGVCSACNATYFSPETCQRLNVAYNLPTKQSSTDTHSSSRAVDNNILTCSLTSTAASNWWQVDLEKERTIKWIHITGSNKNDCSDVNGPCVNRLIGFRVYVSDTSMTTGSSSLPSGSKLCHTDSRTTLEGISPIKVTCRETLRGRYVIIYITNFKKFLVCEVDIFECTDYSYGEACEKECNCLTVNEVCDKITGACQSGCPNGYIGTDCNTACAIGKFGSKCNSICHCQTQKRCDQKSGSCAIAGGCSDGWVSDANRDDCQKRCPLGRYGGDCKEICHCNDNNVCSNTNGACSGNCALGYRSGGGIKNCQTACTRGTFWYGCVKTCRCKDPNRCATTNGVCSQEGCAAGYKNAPTGLQNCQEDCGPGTFGDECASICHCRYDSQCRVKTGRCASGGCEAGWYDVAGAAILNCQTQCPDRLFGLTCSKDCRCKNKEEVCRKKDGHCTSGCSNGWMGLGCQQECPDKKFGFKCNFQCNCKDTQELCNKTTGACPKSNCRDGFIPIDCLSRCPKGKFGGGCKEDCHCSDNENTCDGENGKCMFPGCAPGYKGNLCQTQCDVNTFGFNCSGVCRCNDDKACNFLTGHCNNGCAPGYIGTNCSVECDNGNFGDKCESVCRCKTSGEVCRKKDGHCSSGCAEEYKGPGCTLHITAVVKTDVGSIVGGVVGAILLIVLIGVAVFFFMRYRRNQKDTRYNKPSDIDGAYENPAEMKDVEVRHNHYNEESAHKPTPKPKPQTATKMTAVVIPSVKADDVHIEMQEKTKSSHSSVGKKPPQIPENDPSSIYCNFPGPGENRTCLNVATIWDDVGVKLNDDAILLEEYSSIPKGLLEPTTIADQPEHKGKCRFKGMQAYDHSRVVLVPIPGDPNSHFINANYISSYRAERDNIACQGPVKTIIDDFWRMVWDANVDKIIMLTNLTENGKKKCDQYWPDSKSLAYGGVTVTVTTTETYPDFVIRNFTVTKETVTRVVRQFHFTSWPDHDVPDDTTELIGFWDIVKLSERHLPGKTVVHCSAGVGRTGTYLAFCYLMDKAKVECSIDVHKHVENMRHERTTMVQTPEQYRFLHQVLRDALTCHSGIIYLEDVNNQLVTGVPRNIISTQYNSLEKMRSDIVDNAVTARLSENIAKNRSQSIIAAEKSRVVLSSQVKGRTSYINAVFVKMYGGKHQVISTCRPLPDTVIDLWRLVYEYKLSCIVCLDKFEKSEEGYWPMKGSPLTLGPYEVDAGDCNTDRSWQSTDITITYEAKAPHCLKLLTLEEWNEKGGNSVNALCSLIETAGAIRKSGTSQQILVQCFDGVTRSGVFCAAMSAFQRMTAERTVNIMATVKQIRRSRKQFITSQDQYQLIHRIMMSQHEDGAVYGNL